MSIKGFTPGLEVMNPRGAWSVLAQKRKGSPSRASFMQNMRIAPGVVRCRPGTSVVFPTSGKVTGLFNWVAPGIPSANAGYLGAYYSINGSLHLNVDIPNPTNDAFTSPTSVNFAGWAIAGSNTIASVSIAIDGHFALNATYGAARPDVCAAFPGNAGCPNVGWNALVNLSSYAAGPHIAFFTATDSASNTTSVQIVFNISLPTAAEQNLVLFQDGTAIKRYRQSDGDITVLDSPLPAGQRAPSFADLDVWTYFCGYDTSGAGTIQTQIYDGTNISSAFALGPALTSPTATDAGAGQCNIGTHYFGFVFQDRTGYSGLPTTLFGFATPLSVTLTADQRTISIAVSVVAPATAGGNANLALIMTRADDRQNWYYVANNSQTGSIGVLPVPTGLNATLTFTASISDGDLAASADSANSQFLVLSQDVNGNGPFLPSQVVAYGQRMCYVVGSAIYISDINTPQQLTGDQNVVSMPNQRLIGCAFPLPGSTSLFLTGDRWTAYVTDNSDVPANWSQPIKISDALGAPFPDCVCFRTGGNYVWMALEGGVYLFNGQFEERPITYLFSDAWARVNWLAAYAIKAVDNVPEMRLYVAVPLDGATEPTHLFVIDYQNGLGYDEVDFNIDVYAKGQFSAIGVVKEIGAGLSNLWFGSEAAGYVSRFDPTTHNDVVW